MDDSSTQDGVKRGYRVVEEVRRGDAMPFTRHLDLYGNEEGAARRFAKLKARYETHDEIIMATLIGPYNRIVDQYRIIKNKIKK